MQRGESPGTPRCRDGCPGPSVIGDPALERAHPSTSHSGSGPAKTLAPAGADGAYRSVRPMAAGRALPIQPAPAVLLTPPGDTCNLFDQVRCPERNLSRPAASRPGRQASPRCNRRAAMPWSSDRTSRCTRLGCLQVAAVPEAAQGQSLVGQGLHGRVVAGPADGCKAVRTLFQ